MRRRCNSARVCARGELTRADIPTEKVRGKASLDITEEERDTDASKADASIQRVPPCDLTRVSKISESLSGTTPRIGSCSRLRESLTVTVAIPDQSRMKRSVPALRGDRLSAGPIDEFIVEKNHTVAWRKVAACLLSVFTRRFCRFVFPVPYDYLTAFDILKPEINDLMNDDAAYAAGPERV